MQFRSSVGSTLESASESSQGNPEADRSEEMANAIPGDRGNDRGSVPVVIARQLEVTSRKWCAAKRNSTSVSIRVLSGRSSLSAHSQCDSVRPEPVQSLSSRRPARARNGRARPGLRAEASA
jgi:hypothetical protein